MTHQPRPAVVRDKTRGSALKTPTTPTRHDPQAYLRALLVFMAAARDHLDDPHYLEALPLLEQLRAIPEPRDPDHHRETP